MSKLVPLLFSSVGAATVTVGGFYLVKIGGNSVSRNNSVSSEPKIPDVDLETFTTLDAFENENGGSCVEYVFGDLVFNSKTGEINQNDQITEVDFHSSISEKVKSCLIVNREKTNYSSPNKWKGAFRWIWSFSAGNKGFAMFLTTKENSLSLDVGFYYMENNVVQGQDSVKKWSVNKYKRVVGKSISSDNFGNALPTVGSLITESLEETNRTNWGFLANKDDISKLCSASECSTEGTSSTPLKEVWLWKKTDGASNNVTEWMGNFTNWFQEIFGGANLNLSGFKGFWSKPTTQAAG